jgi:hypothetical protein
MLHIRRLISGVVTGIATALGACCICLTHVVQRMNRPVTVDMDYMEDRIHRQRNDVAAAWRRGGPQRVGVADIGRRHVRSETGSSESTFSATISLASMSY